MATLRNPRHEHFAALVAAGQSPTAAYIAVGYGAKGAATCGSRLLKKGDIQSRLVELQSAAARRTIEKTALSRAWVIEELIDNVRIAKKPDLKGKADISGANQALALLGKELGMFVDRSQDIPWDGSFDKLTEEQARNLTATLESIAFAGRPDLLEKWRRGEPVTIDANPEPNHAQIPQLP
jgi:hypothetical protein